MNSTNKPVCIVTGSSGGIGQGIAKAFLEADYFVVGFDIQAPNIVDANFLGLTVDITDPAAVQQAVQKTAEQGNLNTLVNNAGMQHIAPVEDFDFSRWQRVLDLNLSSCFLLAKSCINVMKNLSGMKSIINIGSIHSKEASANKSAYVAAKHALLGFTRSLAIEGAEHHIKANLIGPGFVKTPLVEKQIPELAKQKNLTEQQVIDDIMLAKTVDKQFTTIEEVAQTALFFAQFPSLALTGQSLLVSHGQNMS